MIKKFYYNKLCYLHKIICYLYKYMPKTPRNIPTRMSPRNNTHYRTTSMNRPRPPSLLLAEHES